MILEHIGLSQINGSLVVLDDVKGVQYDEMVELHLDDGSTRVGRVVRVDGDRCVIQVFEGTRGLSLVNNRTVMTGHPMMMDLSPELLGRVLDGLGRPIDGLGDIYPVARRDVNGAPINPVSRVYPRNYIHTGISSIDCLATLIRGQKLPIFSGSGMKHNELAVQIVKQASVADGSDFAIVFAAMGVKNDVAAYFRESFESCGAMERVVMLLNLANDPIIERIITPRAALTQAVLEGVAFAIRDCVEIARAQGVEIAASTLCGGGAKSPLWREILANVLGIPLTLPQTEQGPGYGGAMLAAVACGAYPSVQACADALVHAKSTTEPDPAIVEKYNARYALWHTLYPALKASYAAMEALQ